MSEEELAAIRQRALKATIIRHERQEIVTEELAWPQDVRASAADVPKLLAEIDRLRAENEKLRQLGAEE